ncbi:hypothetical protein [Aminobacter sp. AP02]|uniref:hypothetical protein n=1 Tax=Aminobacter sp. AP02 TaxID=2135737 RepID=UPI000D6BF9F1|nr:hypothetical protein [Aminobacter sp. AP02]PWK67623.1 hypothetical protein C8K44_112177 [Aminobacter sp. AP02]
MDDHHELTLEDLLHDPIILTVMERDGYCPDDIRLLARHAVAGTQVWESVSLRVNARRQNRVFRASTSSACIALCS